MSELSSNDLAEALARVFGAHLEEVGLLRAALRDESRPRSFGALQVVLNDATRFDATGSLTLLIRVQQMAAKQPELDLEEFVRDQDKKASSKDDA